VRGRSLAEMRYNMASQGAPDVDSAEIRGFLADRYQLTVLRVKRLGGEINQNARVDVADGRSFVVKIANDLSDEEQLRWQCTVLRHLESSADIPVPRLVPGADGDDLQRLRRNERTNLVHLLTWLDGRMLAELDRHSPALLNELGQVAGRLSIALGGLTDTAPVRSHHWDLRLAREAVDSCLGYVTDEEDRVLVERTMQGFDGITDTLASLPSGTVHQDLNDFNVLASPDEHGRHHISGVLDVGDALHTVRVAELAVAVGYAMLRSGDPLRAAVEVVRGYRRVAELTEAEVACVFPMATARLCVNATTWTRRQALDQNAYGASRMRHTWPLLRRLGSVPPQLAEAAFRHSCGMLAAPSTAAVVAALRRRRPQVPLPGRIQPTRLTPEPFTREWAPADATSEPATLRLSAELAAPVTLPADGVAEEVAADRVVLRHNADQPFWTVWTGVDGGIRPGEHIAAGRLLRGELDAPHDPPSTVRLVGEADLAATLPDKVQPWLKAVWDQLCPDPAALWGLEPAPRPDDVESIVRIRTQHLGRSQRYYYEQPVNLVDSHGVWLRDENGAAYLDAINNVTHVGHANEYVASAVAAQMQRLNTNSRFVYAALAQYAQRLAGLLPDPLEVVYFACTGSEANDLALRIVRQVTGREHVVVLDGAYHGNTTAVTAISPDRFDAPGGLGRGPTTHTVLQPNRYRGPYGYDLPDAGERYADDVRAVVTDLVATGRAPAAFFSESLMGTAGEIVLPPRYLAAAFNMVRAAGGLCVSDEVQIGFGRLGDEFWGFQTHGVVPDLVTMGKPMANGMPVSAVVTTRAIADEFDKGLKYFNTFGGSPVCCAAGMAVLDVIESESLQERAREVGGYLLRRLGELRDRHPLIGDVRGHGLYAGVELVRDRTTKEPAAVEAAFISERMKELGVFVYPNGRHGNILKIKPPMVFGTEHVDVFAGTLDRIMSQDW
jgi:4-aminobutyrate aminotransferase-like enzyme/Ser/Thr protein kinase RdoA (MazF antagonist)